MVDGDVDGVVGEVGRVGDVEEKGLLPRWVEVFGDGLSAVVLVIEVYFDEGA